MDLAEPLNEPVAPSSPPVAALDEDRRPTMARGVFRAVSAAAALAIVVASVLNWLWLTQYAPVPRTAEAVLQGSVATSYRIPKPSTGGELAVKKLTPTIIGYETIARHQVPGAGRAKAEAIYKSLDMNVEVQVAINIYATVEMMASQAAARERAQEIMRQYPVRQQDSLVASATPAFTGFTEDQGARAIVWVRDTYVTFVKTQYGRSIPAQRQDFLKNVGTPVANATDIYQRTGKSGIEVGKTK